MSAVFSSPEVTAFVSALAALDAYETNSGNLLPVLTRSFTPFLPLALYSSSWEEIRAVVLTLKSPTNPKELDEAKLRAGKFGLRLLALALEKMEDVDEWDAQEIGMWCTRLCNAIKQKLQRLNAPTTVTKSGPSSPAKLSSSPPRSSSKEAKVEPPPFINGNGHTRGPPTPPLSSAVSAASDHRLPSSQTESPPPRHVLPAAPTETTSDGPRDTEELLPSPTPSLTPVIKPNGTALDLALSNGSAPDANHPGSTRDASSRSTESSDSLTLHEPAVPFGKTPNADNGQQGHGSPTTTAPRGDQVPRCPTRDLSRATTVKIGTSPPGCAVPNGIRNDHQGQAPLAPVAAESERTSNTRTISQAATAKPHVPSRPPVIPSKSAAPRIATMQFTPAGLRSSLESIGAEQVNREQSEQSESHGTPLASPDIFGNDQDRIHEHGIVEGLEGVAASVARFQFREVLPMQNGHHGRHDGHETIEETHVAKVWTLEKNKSIDLGNCTFVIRRYLAEDGQVQCSMRATNQATGVAVMNFIVQPGRRPLPIRLELALHEKPLVASGFMKMKFLRFTGSIGKIPKEFRLGFNTLNEAKALKRTLETLTVALESPHSRSGSI